MIDMGMDVSIGKETDEVHGPPVLRTVRDPAPEFGLEDPPRLKRGIYQAGPLIENPARTQRLLAHFQIETPMMRYTDAYDRKKEQRLAAVLDALDGGDVALVSEAGMPGLADPGYELVAAALERRDLESGVGILDLFVRSGLCSSKAEARRLVTQGGAYLDGEKVDSIELVLDSSFAEREEVLLRAGKKRYFRFLIE